ncbi:MAG: V-type ATP synthase subunit E [Geobacteraceae bacterium]|nr:V-type ATP synthase subunit E [Geobacteraceae bacterium]
MGQRELIEALRKEGDEKCAAIRREAEAESERIVSAAAAEIGRLREEYARRRADACAAETAAILAEAASRGRLVRLAAESALAERVYGLACGALPLLREEEYGALFAALARELPPCQWETVRVNPADEQLARSLFPRAAVITDGALVGGFEVTAAEGGMRVVNTLEKRLERGWPELLPGLFKDIYKSAEFGVRNSE